MNTASRPMHRRSAPGRPQRALGVLAVLLGAAILITLGLDRIFSSLGMRAGTGSGVAATQTRPLAPFTGLELGGANTVNVHVGTRQSVIVRADNNLLRRVTTRVQSGSLVIGTTPGRLNAKTPMSVDVNLPALNAITLKGSGMITVTGINSRSFAALIPGSGTIRVTGTTTRLDVMISGGGTARLDQLIARDATASVTGSGSIMLMATHSLNASVSGSGAILYSGDPPRATQSVTGGGTISAR